MNGIVAKANVTCFLSSQLLTALQTILKLCQDNINTDIVLDDAREILIQHTLTEEIFNTVFSESSVV